MLKKTRKRAIRFTLLAANLVVLGGVAAFVVSTSNTRQVVSKSAATATVAEDIVTNPLDQISSADIAVHVAKMTNLYQATAVINNADTINAQLAYVASTSTVVAKPQVITTQLRSISDLRRYLTKSGDNVSKLAERFGITSDSIKWSNNLTGNELTSGIYLWIPPVNGIVYTIQAGDTAASLARDFNVSKDAILVFNDAELSGLKPGQRIVIPGGTKSIGGGGGGGGLTLLWRGSGGYDYGWCTYYASAKGGVPGGWGNANTWHLYAPLSGWTVSTVPRAGAVAQTTYGWAGHVGIVEAVRQLSDGSYEIKYSDMNGLAGWNRVGHSDWVPAIGKYQRYIYK